MAWEKRKHSGGRYYTRSYREGGRVRRQYVGKGRLAELWAWFDAVQREEREIDAEERREERRQRDAYYASVFGPLDVLDAACDAAIRRDLEAAGYHKHKGMEWRRYGKARERHGDTNATQAQG